MKPIKQDVVAISDVVARLVGRADPLDIAAGDTPSKFVRAIYQAQSQALREVADELVSPAGQGASAQAQPGPRPLRTPVGLDTGTDR